MTREVEARLKLSAVDKTGNVLSKIGKQMADVNRRAVALNRQQGLLAKSTMAMYGALARFAGPAVLAYGLKQAVVEFADVERKMNRIGITAGATKDETTAAFTEIQRQAKSMAMPLDQATTALDTLVSSGMSLREAMDFLPSVLATAQASGADTADIANTAIKAASALKLEAGQMQHAFDIMVEGGKAGQFELKDMASYIPGLANSFASLGYSGEDGLKKLVALMQTVREDTGTAEEAATDLQNIFGKIYSQDTAQKFKKMGIDLNAELAKAKKNGEDTVAAFVRISNEAIKGDLTKLPKLFTDQQFRLGMQSLMTSADSYAKFLKTVNDGKVDGTVFRDLKRITDDTQASIDRLSSSWDKFMLSIGKGASRLLVPAMDAVSNDIDYGEAMRTGLEKRGMTSYTDREWWIARELPFGPLSHSRDADFAAMEGGYKNDDLRAKYRQGPNLPGGWTPPDKDAPKGSIPIPRIRPSDASLMAPEYSRNSERWRQQAIDAAARDRSVANDQALNDFYGSGDNDQARAHMNRKQAFRERRAALAMADDNAATQAGRDGDIRMTGLTQGFDDGASKAVDVLKAGATDSGKTMGDEAAVKLKSEASAIGAQIGQSIAATIKAQVGQLSLNVNAGAKVNANTGRTSDFVKTPVTAYHGPK